MTADAIADGPEPEDDETEQPPVHARLGEYRLVQRLGEGGMGVVHLALDRHGRAVAIKVLRQHIAHDPDARARLTREVKSLSRITSPRVAPIIDADVDGPTPYIVTRYVPGPSLDDYVAERGLLPPADLHRVASGLAEALDAIHSAGVVHRDVKPGNVLLVDGEPVLIDFGIAHVADDIRLTMTGLVMGTPGYLAPEVVGGEDVTQATDWWGWAATTAFAASGTPPFGTGPMSAVLARVSAGDPDLEAVDPRIEPLLYAALSPNPSERPHHHEVVAALERYAHGAPVTEAIQVRRVRPETQRLSVPPTTALPLPPPPPSRPAVAPVIGAAAAGAGLAARGGGYAVPPASGPPVPARMPSPAPAPSPLPPPMVTTGRPAGPPGWEQARPVARQSPQPAPQARPAPLPQQLAPAPGQPGPPGAPVPDSESDWDAARLGHGPWGDPRIGRPSRSGTLLALLAVLAAVSARAPVVAVLGLLAWVTLARTADRSVTSLVMRRHERGARGSDVAVAVATSPWHLVLGLVGAAATLVLPLFVGVCAMFASALVLTAVRGTDVRTDDVLPLVVAGVFAGLTAWWGPGGASLRRGSRSIVRGLTPGEAAGQVAAGILLVVAAVVLAMTVTGDGPTWWPRTTPPGWASQVVPTL
ncbi:MAG TPA: serine/threonine-protein kinase [Ornithinibacter sp.]|nr:serine/threonine-protein kinase [Ornithinibacter sp.]